MADLGSDIAGLDDIDPTMPTVEGRRCLIQSIARRLITPRGGLWYDPDYGYDLRQYLSGITVSAGAIASGVEAEAEKDERVEQASASVVFSGRVLTVRLAISDSQGPFSFSLAIDQVTATILTTG